MSPKFIFIPSAAAPAQFLLDLYPNADAAWSFRKLKSGIDTPIRIRRDSDDAETDVDFDPATIDGFGNITISLNSNVSSGGTLATWIGANNGFLVRRYDQSGNGNDYNQNTLTDQPKIINSGYFELSGGNIAALYDGVDDFMTTGNLVFPETGDINISMHLVYQSNVIGSINDECPLGLTPNVSGGTRRYIQVTSESPNLGVRLNGGNTIFNGGDDQTQRISTTAKIAANSDFVARSNGADLSVLSSGASKDLAIDVSSGYTEGLGGQSDLSGIVGTPRFFDGYVQESVIYLGNNQRWSDRVAIETDQNNFYSRF